MTARGRRQSLLVGIFGVGFLPVRGQPEGGRFGVDYTAVPRADQRVSWLEAIRLQGERSMESIVMGTIIRSAPPPACPYTTRYPAANTLPDYEDLTVYDV